MLLSRIWLLLMPTIKLMCMHLERNTVDLDILKFFYNSLYGRKDTVDYSEPAEIKDYNL